MQGIAGIDMGRIRTPRSAKGFRGVNQPFLWLRRSDFYSLKRGYYSILVKTKTNII